MREMLIAHGLRAEIVSTGSDGAQPTIWVPAQHYARAMELMARMAQLESTAPEASADEARAPNGRAA